MRRYELYARFALVADQGARNNNCGTLLDYVERCGGVNTKLVDCGDVPLARWPSKLRYAEARTSDVCVLFDLSGDKVADLEFALNNCINQLIISIVVRKDEDGGG